MFDVCLQQGLAQWWWTPLCKHRFMIIARFCRISVSSQSSRLTTKIMENDAFDRFGRRHACMLGLMLLFERWFQYISVVIQQILLFWIGVQPSFRIVSFWLLFAMCSGLGVLDIENVRTKNTSLLKSVPQPFRHRVNFSKYWPHPSSVKRLFSKPMKYNCI